MSRNEVVELIRIAAGGNADGHFIDCDHGSFDVHVNDEWSRSKSLAGGVDAFLYFRYVVDVEENAREFIEADYIATIRNVMASLISSGASVVAACDFEDQLWTR